MRLSFGSYEDWVTRYHVTGGKQGYNEHFVRMTAETTVAPGASRANSAACCPNDNNMRLMKPIRRCNQKGTCQLERE